MKTKLKLLVSLTALAFSLLFIASPALSAEKEPVPTIAIFNYVTYPILDDSIAGIKEGLKQAGYTAESARIIEVSANGEPDKVAVLARELIQLRPDVIIPVSTPVSKVVLKEAPPGQRIVYSTVTNPADIGMNKKPANATGVSDVVDYDANFDLIFSLFPKTKTIGMPYNAGEPNAVFGLENAQRISKKRGFVLKAISVSNTNEVMDAVRSLVTEVDVIYVGSDNTVAAAIPGLTKIAYARRKPVIASDAGSVRDGALAAVSVDYVRLGRKSGEIAAEVVKTKKMPGEIAPVRFLGDAIFLNERAASAIGIKFPEEIRAKAHTIVP